MLLYSFQTVINIYRKQTNKGKNKMETQYITIEIKTNLEGSELLDLVIDMVAPAIIQEVNCYGEKAIINEEEICVGTRR